MTIASLVLFPERRITSRFDIAPALSDWHAVKVRQQDVTPLEDSSDAASLEGLRKSILNELGEMATTWRCMGAALSVDISDTSLPESFGPINDLAAQVDTALRENATDILSIDTLIANFDTAIRKIYRSRQLPWGTWRSVGSQRSVTSVDALTPYALAAHTALSHIDKTVKLMRTALAAAQCVETQHKEVERGVPMSPVAILKNRRVVAQAFAKVGKLLNSTTLLVNGALTRATAAMPRDRRYWKTKISVLVILCVLTVALGVASVMLPPLLPAVLGLGLGLKFSAALIGILSTTHSIFNVVGYPRNRGWTDLTNCITKVRNLYQTLNQQINARQLFETDKETTEITGKIEALSEEIDTLGDMQDEMAQKVDTRSQRPRHK
ncbi:hypothetical protein PCA20602_01407 [Pandoraea capi]|uniref:Transmembrane protein n=1 Tax=Pandoraea capi TaxID=2508286 RepID=A0ABY6VTG7_9BURK|nr:hypothetical protein [Pandoraea capi]VVD86772.1 hypothetical protein PCA20602_01407 [Pandoraea capi]